MSLTYFLFLATLLTLGESYSTTCKTVFNHPNIQELDHDSALTAIKRDNICTLLLLGANWDGHFKKFVQNGYWQELSESLGKEKGIDVAFLEYSGASEGPMSIPDEILFGKRTLGSFMWFMFRDGKRLRISGKNEMDSNFVEGRQCFGQRNSKNGDEKDNGFDLECLQSICGDKSMMDEL